MNALHSTYRALWQREPIRRSGLGRFLFKRLARAGAAPSYEFTTDFFGLKYRGNLNNNIDFHVYYYGAFEKPLIFFLGDALTALSPGGVFVDVGANVGHHSLYLSKFASQVHAFEPYAPVREKLIAQMELNQLRNVNVHPVGLSDTNTRQAFFAPTGRNAGIGSFDASTTEKGNKQIGELELVRGDDYLPAHGIARVDLMKMDVEGFEKPALVGLANTLRANRPVLVCEITYGKPLSIASMAELRSLLPERYALFTFDLRKPDGTKARRRDAQTRHSGDYRLIPYTDFRTAGQDNIIACPEENVSRLPTRRPA